MVQNQIKFKRPCNCWLEIEMCQCEYLPEEKKAMRILTEEKRLQIKINSKNIDRLKMKARIKAILKAFPDGLTAMQVHYIDSVCFGSKSPEISVRARLSESEDFEITTKTKLGKYNAREHFYRLRTFKI